MLIIEKTDKMNRYDKEQKFKYISDVTDYYNKCCGKCEGIQLKNLKEIVYLLKILISEM